MAEDTKDTQETKDKEGAAQPGALLPTVTEEDQQKANQEIANAFDKQFQERADEPKKADSSRLYFRGVGGVPDGYYDELTEEDLEGIKQRMPDVYEAVQRAADEHKAGDKKKASATPDEAKSEESDKS